MTFQCKENCCACCGIIGFSKELIKKTETFAQVKPIALSQIGEKIFPITEDRFCIYLNRTTKKCVIYDLRPQICRVYGNSEEIPCPYIKPDGTIRTFTERKIVQMRINNTVDTALEKLKSKSD